MARIAAHRRSLPSFVVTPATASAVTLTVLQRLQTAIIRVPVSFVSAERREPAVSATERSVLAVTLDTALLSSRFQSIC